MIKNKILTIFLALMICLALAGPAYSAPEKFHFSLGFHGSLAWIPSDETIRDIYGTNFHPFGFFVRGEIGQNFALEASTDFIFESGTPLTLWGEPAFGATARMTSTNVFISAIYGISLDKDFSPYFGAGFSTCNFEETLTVSGFSESASETATGFHFFAGIQRFWKIFGAKAEIRYLSATVEGIQGDVNIGGFGVYTGVMIRFGVSAK